MNLELILWMLGFIGAILFVFYLIYDLAEPDPYNKRGKW